MTSFRVYGGTPAEQEWLQSATGTALTAIRDAGEGLARGAGDDTVWLVAAGRSADYQRSFFALDERNTDPPPAAILFFSAAGESVFPDDAGLFHGQVRVGDPQGAAFLGRVARCPRVLAWADAAADVPGQWFGRLTGPVAGVPVSRLPFDRESREHLRGCADCREEVRALLTLAGRARLAAVCPPTERLVQWLEDPAGDPALEAHVRGCRSCQGVIRRQAALWRALGFAGPEQVTDKLGTVGLAPDRVPVKAPQVPRPWEVGTVLTRAPLTWELPQTAPFPFLSAVVTHGLGLGRIAYPGERSSPGTGERVFTLDELTDRLSHGGEVTVIADDRWLYFRVEAGSLALRAGVSAAERLPQFQVVFTRGDALVLAVRAQDGVASLTENDLQTARAGGADAVALIYSPSDLP